MKRPGSEWKRLNLGIIDYWNKLRSDLSIPAEDKSAYLLIGLNCKDGDIRNAAPDPEKFFKMPVNSDDVSTCKGEASEWLKQRAVGAYDLMFIGKRGSTFYSAFSSGGLDRALQHVEMIFQQNVVKKHLSSARDFAKSEHHHFNSPQIIAG